MSIAPHYSVGPRSVVCHLLQYCTWLRRRIKALLRQLELVSVALHRCCFHVHGFGSTILSEVEGKLEGSPPFALERGAEISRVPYRIGIFRSVSVSIFRYLQKIPYRRQNRSVCRIVRNYDKARNMIKLKIKGPF